MKMKLAILFIFSVMPFMAYSQGKSCDYLANLNAIDDSGFAPDVKLSIPEKEWVGYVLKDIKKRG